MAHPLFPNSKKGPCLIVPRDQVLTKPYHLWVPELHDRDIVDDKAQLNPLLKQLLPYITFYYLRDDGVVLYLTYLRQRGGNEPGLHDMRSIGIGGHVDDLPQPGQLLIDTLAFWATEEIQQETGLQPDSAKVLIALRHAFRVGHFHLIEDQEPVHSVHLGIQMYYPLTQKEFEFLSVSQGEENQVEDIRFQTEEQIRAAGNCYELWSRKALDEFVPKYVDSNVFNPLHHEGTK